MNKTNLLFLNYSFPSPTSGGTERVIHNLSKYFVRFNYEIFVGFFEGNYGQNQFITKSIYLGDTNKIKILNDFISQNKIDIVIIFKKDIDNKVIKVIKKNHCPIIYSLHYSLDDSIQKQKNMLNDKERFNSLKWKLKRTFKQIFLIYANYLDKMNMIKINNNVDKIVLLSNRFIEPFVNRYGIKNKNKITAINNSLSFDNSIEIEDIKSKMPILLVVARMEEKSKRIFILLDIWKSTQDKMVNSDWQLVVIGDGSDLKRYKNYCLTNEIDNVRFLGRIDPKEYYMNSSIFLMTSSAEGFGMTLIEAQQMGCVPIAFDSFASLHDIIVDKKNGIIVNNNNIEEYVDKLLWLIQNKEEREQMAKNAVEDCKKFSLEVIGNQWIKIFNELE